MTKAYKILTEEEARENFKKYGNPDGPGSYNVGIALPRFLLQKENHIPVLIAAFFILLVCIPAYVYINYGGTVHLDDNGIHVSNRQIFGTHLNENILAKTLPSLISRCTELQELRCDSNEAVE